MTKLNILGFVFERLTVIAEAPSRGKHAYWLCKCQCGSLREVEIANLRSGRSKSCGCLRDELAIVAAKTRFKKHGDHATKLYRTFKNMHQRCALPSHPAYPMYGAKGITVSPVWDTYEVFRSWALKNGYTDLLTLDRIDGEKGYYPENCRWATCETQARNRRKRTNPTSSQFIGVGKQKGTARWIAYVCVGKVNHRLGLFDTEILAAQARDQYIIDQGLQYFKMNF